MKYKGKMIPTLLILIHRSLVYHVIQQAGKQQREARDFADHVWAHTTDFDTRRSQQYSNYFCHLSRYVVHGRVFFSFNNESFVFIFVEGFKLGKGSKCVVITVFAPHTHTYGLCLRCGKSASYLCITKYVLSKL